MRDLTIALVQTTLHWHDAAANRAHFEGLLDGLGGHPDLVVLPEMFSTGFTMAAADQAETMDGTTVAWMRELAAGLGSTVTGSLVVRDADKYFNRLIWMPPDGNPQTYDKRHLFRMAGEHEIYAPGSSRPVFRLGDWRVRPLICYDLRFPVWSRGIDAFDLLLYVANWPRARRSAWQTLLPARAVENLCYSAGVNRIGRDGQGIEYAGDSGAWDFFGGCLADCGAEESVTQVRLDAAALMRYRQKFPAHRDADPFEISEDKGS